MPAEWMSDANCRKVSPTPFFLSDELGVERAQKICRGRPVAEPCLKYALVHHIDHRVWGGASERERRRIARRRRQSIVLRSLETAC